MTATSKKLFSILTLSEKKKAAAMLGLMLIGMGLETLSIGLIIPAITLLARPGELGRWLGDKNCLGAIAGAAESELAIFGMLLLMLAYGLKTLFLGFLAWRQSDFVYQVQADLSQRLFAGYLRQPYTFHLERNSAQLIRNMTGLVGEFIVVTQYGMVLVAEILVIVGIAALLVAVEPIGALSVVGILGLAGWGLNLVTRRRLLKWGEQRQHHEGFRIQHLQQGLGGVKEVKLMGCEEEFLNKYRTHTAQNAKISKWSSTQQAMPRLGLEMLAVSGLVLLVCIMIWQGKPMQSLLPALALFAGAAFRFMPSVNRVIVAMQAMRMSIPAIDILEKELKSLDISEPVSPSRKFLFRSELRLEGLNFRYSGTDAFVLQDINLTIFKGLTVGFVGGSGAGKSTLVDIILGLLTPVSGAVIVDGINIQENIRGWQDQIGYVPQVIYLTDDSLRHNIAFGLPTNKIDDNAVQRAVKSAQLEQFVNELPLGLETVVGERGVRLSGGQRQRIGIARALYHNPSVLVLDEATSALDIKTEEGVMEAIRNLHGEKTILIVAHRLSTVESCDIIVHFEKGKIKAVGRPQEILKNLNSN